MTPASKGDGLRSKDTGDDEAEDAFNRNHVRVLSASLGILDQRLAELEAAMQAVPSPLSGHVVDLDDEQCTAVLDQLAWIRERLAAAAATLGLPPRERVPITNAILAVLVLAQVAFADLAPTRLCGYGELGPMTSLRLASVLADLDSEVQRFATYLARR